MMKRTLIILFIIYISMAISCTGNINGITNDLFGNRQVALQSPIPIKEIPKDKTLIIGRIVYYIDGNPVINTSDKIELCFIHTNNILKISDKINKATFYELKIDENGYFFILVDRKPLALSYIYLGANNKIYSIPACAFVILKETSVEVYTGEIQVINRENGTSLYFIDTLFEFYNNQKNALPYLEEHYGINPNEIEIIPFTEPSKGVLPIVIMR